MIDTRRRHIRSRFQSQYFLLACIATSMIETGKLLSASPVTATDEKSKEETRMFKSLRGALLAICYSSTILSASATVGLILLGRQLQSEEQ
ncbi:hypothetical protein IFM89_023285 [Coptis chinensis]|uniref:Uncharacterized protein n=1 Tax=Coptis chinensis TaxID=261450 RepID=A0A835LFD2_9MAGN|nr:hypothetical protein IFM89_023285 [Coptis chinensis]